MAYRANPFLERMSERTTTDHDFVRLFSPRVLERLEEDAFEGALHIFRSPPGGGKTTLLRALTPQALRAFWNARHTKELSDACQGLILRGVLHEQDGPQLLGVYLSCASGYADLPPGMSVSHEGMFRSLLDCRIVLRTVRSLMALLGLSTTDQLAGVKTHVPESKQELQSIPQVNTAAELLAWAEQRERSVYAELEQSAAAASDSLGQVRLEGVIWLQHVVFTRDNRTIAPRRLLMVDDLHKLRKKQRRLLIEELSEGRPGIPVWCAERTIALGEDLLAQGVRLGREVREYTLEDLWGDKFAAFGQNVLDRRLGAQSVIPSGTFAQYLRSELDETEVATGLDSGRAALSKELVRYRGKARYAQWLSHAEALLAAGTLEALQEVFVTRALLERDERKRQLTLDLEPLPEDQLDKRDSSALQGAAQIFVHEELGVPYYFGIKQLLTLATNNVEELLAIAGALYDGLKAKQVLRKPELVLSPLEQERLILGVMRQRMSFVPKAHTEGVRASRLLEAIGQFCRSRTFLPNAPIAPGVTGVRLTDLEVAKLEGVPAPPWSTLRRVLAECVADNLLTVKQSAATTGRRAGTIFYLNRGLCAHFGLPLQLGGWQDSTTEDLVEWMEKGWGRIRRLPEVKS